MKPGVLVRFAPKYIGQTHILLGVPLGHDVPPEGERHVRTGSFGLFLGWYSGGARQSKSQCDWQALVMVGSRVGWVFADEIRKITE